MRILGKFFYSKYRSLFILIFPLLLSACVNLRVPLQAEPNSGLPAIKNVRTINDVTSIGLEWDLANDSNVYGFVIAQEISKDTLKVLDILRNPFATHYYISNLKPETNYTFYLYTIGADDSHSSPKILKLKTSFIDPVDKVFTSQNLPKQIKVFWTPHENPSIQSYVIERKERDGTYTEIAQVSNRLYVEYFDTNLKDNQNYQYRVLARNSKGALSRPSKPSQGLTRTRPPVINIIHATKDEPKSITINFTPPIDLKYPAKIYKIYASNNANGSFYEIGRTSTKTFTESDLGDNKQRFYKVSIVDEDGLEGDLALNPARGRTLPKPPTPIIMQSFVKDRIVTVTWKINSPDPSRNYNFTVCKSISNQPTQKCFEDVAKTGFIDKDVLPGVTYVYTIYSNDVQAKTRSAPSQNIRLEI